MAGGGEGDGVHSFGPPPVPLFSEGPIYRNSCYQAGPDLPKRGGRNRQSDGCTEFIFLDGSGWAQADQLIKDHTPRSTLPPPPLSPASEPKCSGLQKPNSQLPNLLMNPTALAKGAFKC